MGFLKKTKGSIISDSFKILQKLGQFNEGLMIDVALYEDHLMLTAPFMKKDPIKLSYSKITDVFYGLDTDIVEKNKSVIGRAIVGGLLFGGAGAVVGAVSGVGTKQKKENKFVFIISYTGSDGNVAFLQFEDTRLYRGRKVANTLAELCNIELDGKKKSSETIYEL